jgi:CoA:oxalate CoA-transferase
MLVEVDQPQVGRMRIVGSPIRLSETPGEVYAPAPMLGEHSEEVLRTVLGYTDEQVKALKDGKVINGEV